MLSGPKNGARSMRIAQEEMVRNTTHKHHRVSNDGFHLFPSFDTRCPKGKEIRPALYVEPRVVSI